MSLETEIKKLTAALEANTVALSAFKGGTPVAETVTPPPVAETVTPPPASDTPPTYTADQVNEVLQVKAMAMNDGGAAIFAILQAPPFSAQNVSTLDPSKYTALVNAVNELGG